MGIPKKKMIVFFFFLFFFFFFFLYKREFPVSDTFFFNFYSLNKIQAQEFPNFKLKICFSSLEVASNSPFHKGAHYLSCYSCMRQYSLKEHPRSATTMQTIVPPLTTLISIILEALRKLDSSPAA